MALLLSSDAGSRIKVRGDDYFQGASATTRGGGGAAMRAVSIAGLLFLVAAVAVGMQHAATGRRSGGG